MPHALGKGSSDSQSCSLSEVAGNRLAQTALSKPGAGQARKVSRNQGAGSSWAVATGGWSARPALGMPVGLSCVNGAPCRRATWQPGKQPQ